MVLQIPLLFPSRNGYGHVYEIIGRIAAPFYRLAHLKAYHALPHLFLPIEYSWWSSFLLNPNLSSRMADKVIRAGKANVAFPARNIVTRGFEAG